MLPTPSTAHVDVTCIYEPAEDSFLLLDTLSSNTESEFLQNRLSSQPSQQAPSPTPIVLEVGTGSGVVLAFLTAHAGTIFGRYDIVALGSDVNAYACRATQQTVLQACRNTNNSGYTAVPATLSATLCADLTSPLRSGVADVLIFNPPYVPSPDVPGFRTASDCSAQSAMSTSDANYNAGSFERDSQLLALSYAGGVDGMEVTNRLLEEIPTVLSQERGVAYILLCQQNRPEEVLQRIRQWGSRWDVEIVGRSGKKAGWEKLVIIRIWRT
jgi:release factor glutamine methyltransferase